MLAAQPPLTQPRYHAMSASGLTPAKRLQRPRPSLVSLAALHAASSPTPSSAVDMHMLARKTSYNQLTQNSLASIPDASAGYGLSPMRGERATRGRDLEVGDMVDTPNGLYGTVKFIGTVKGKAGTFVGVELEPEIAGKGKNDGAVDGCACSPGQLALG